MSTDIAVMPKQETAVYVSPEAERFNMEQRMAKLFVASGLFGDIRGVSETQAIAQSWVKIAMGNSMGFSPAESMQGIDIIQGRPSVGAQLRASRLQRNGYSWSIDRLDATGCVLTVYLGGKPLGPADFLEDDAKRAGLLAKDNWKKDPTSMYFARAITRAQRRYAPGVLSLDMMSREEVIDLGPEFVEVGQGSERAAAATQSTTEALSGKIAAERTRRAKPMAEPEPPILAPSAEPLSAPAVEAPPVAPPPSTPPPAVLPGTQRPPMPSTAKNEWPKRTRDTFHAALGDLQYIAVLQATIKSSDDGMVNAANHSTVWAMMETFAKAKEIMDKQQAAQDRTQADIAAEVGKDAGDGFRLL